MAERVKTGGLKEFHYTDEDMERIRNTDTESTLEFKKSLALYNYFKDMDSSADKKQVRKYVDFFDLKLDVKDNKGKRINYTLDICYEISPGKFKHVKTMKAGTGINLNLPRNRYKMIFTRKVFVFFRKSHTEYIMLDKDMLCNIIF